MWAGGREKLTYTCITQSEGPFKKEQLLKDNWGVHAIMSSTVDDVHWMRGRRPLNAWTSFQAGVSLSANMVSSPTEL